MLTKDYHETNTDNPIDFPKKTKITPTLAVGDLHGRYEIVEKVLATDYNIVFIGDYLDSYDRSTEDIGKTIYLVLKAIKDFPEKVTGLLGNHEMSYLDIEMKASGYRRDFAEDYLPALDLSLLKPYIWINNYLLSHAGVSRYLTDDVDKYLAEGQFNQIGTARGGLDSVGGLYWCDWFKEFEPIPGVNQVVGHSGYRPTGAREGILELDGNYNIDCFQYTEEFLLIKEDGSAEIITEL